MHLRHRHEASTGDAGSTIESNSSVHSNHPHSPHKQIPSFSSDELDRNLLYRLSLMVLMLLVVLLVILTNNNSSSSNNNNNNVVQARKQQQRPFLPGVCSHQILNPPPLKGEDYNTAPDGSLDAMTALWHTAAGVHCYDVDVIVLSDGTLLASHPRRLKGAIELATSTAQSNNNNDKSPEDEIILEEFTLESLSTTLGFDSMSIRGGRKNSSPFPIFDEEVLPHFAELAKGIPGAFSQEAQTKASSSTIVPWSLKGPVLNIDLKQGPYLTKEIVLELAQQIHALELEDYVAICVTSNDENEASTQLDVLEILHEHNIAAAAATAKPIPLTLVLRDLVPEDFKVERIRKLVEEMYPESIRALVPSFKFPIWWYQQIRKPQASESGSIESIHNNNELWKLPMTVWTIDSKVDYASVASITTTLVDENGNEWKHLPTASAVVANRPVEILRYVSSKP